MRRPAIVMLLLLAFALAAAPATPMGQAEALLATGQFEKARDLLQTIVAQDPKDARAWEAMLVAQLALRKDDEALATARKVLALGPAGRVTVMNAAIAHARVDDPIAGAKLIHQHLEANPEPLDEPMLDVLGTILSQVDPDDRTDAACVLATRFYDAYNAKLEAQVSGRKRWGVRWLNADEADENRQRLAAAEAATAAVQKKIKKLEDDIADARRDVFRATELAKRRPREKDKVEKAVVRLNELEAAHLSLQTDLQRAISDEVRPEFLESLDPVMLDDNTPPPVGTPVEQRFKRPVEPKRLGGFDGDVSVLPMPVRENEPPSQRNQTSRPVRREGPPPREVAGFSVAPDLLVTAAGPLEGVREVQATMGDGTPLKAVVIRRDPKLGLALLRVVNRRLGYLQIAPGFDGGEVQYVSFPTENIFDPSAELIAGQAGKQSDRIELKLERDPRLLGGPVIAKGKVVGVVTLLKDEDVTHCVAIGCKQLREFLGADLPRGGNGGSPDPGTVTLQLSPVSR